MIVKLGLWNVNKSWPPTNVLKVSKMLKLKLCILKRAVKFHFWWFLWFIIGIVNTFFQVSPLLLYWNQTCCFQQGIRCAKRLKNCRLTVNFSIIGCFLRILEIRTTYVSESAAYHNYLERSYCHHIRALFVFQILQYVNI